MLFTRPRRFGKTLNLSMLEHFFDCDKKSRHLFDGLSIEKDERSMAHQGRYPVVSVTLKGIKKLNFEESLSAMRELLSNIIEDHMYLLSSDKVTGKAALEALLDGSADKSVMESSLKRICKALEQYHGEKAILLIDEYDVPLESAYFNGFYPEMIDFMRSFLSTALKTNRSLAMAVLTGCLRISRESIFTGLNNLEVNTVLSKMFDEYFGFTQPEVDALLTAYDLVDKSPEVSEWYNGYIFGNTDVYNPWSLLCYVKQHVNNRDDLPEAYWANTSANDIVRSILDRADMSTRREIETLIAGGHIEKKIHDDITYDEVFKSIDNVWNFLFFTGYLKKIGEPIKKNNNMYYKLEIPNEEVRYIYQNKISEWISETVVAKGDGDLVAAALSGDAEGFQRILGMRLQLTISYYDEKEMFYHGFLAGLLSDVTDNFEMLSNREEGNGRPDIVIFRAGFNDLAVIIEVKTSDTYEGLRDACRAAFKQIEDKHYDAYFTQREYKAIFKYAVAFFEKDCRVELIKQ
jgi:hypothetical protein